jgi:hypothetical protein
VRLIAVKRTHARPAKLAKKKTKLTDIQMDEDRHPVAEKRRRHWILMPMREQPLLVIAIYLLPLAIALFLAALFG